MRGGTKPCSHGVALVALVVAHVLAPVAQAQSIPQAPEPEPASDSAPESDSASGSGSGSDSAPESDSASGSAPVPAPEPAPAPAPAPHPPVAEEIYSVGISYVRNPGSKLHDALALRTGTLELGAELLLLTSAAELAGEPIGFTDVGMLRLRARKSLSAALELFAATQLLAKQPSASDASLWQGALAGALWSFAPDLGLVLQASAGPVLDAGDGYLSVGPTLVTKQAVDHHVRFELGLGYAFTALDLVAPRDVLFHVHEAVAHAEVQLGDRSGGFFARFAYHLPFASGPSEERSPGRYLDPSPQLNVQLGAILTAGQERDWDIYGVCSIVDRGELDDATTTLPILDGGFDQQQWIFGVLHRFGAEPSAPSAR